MKFPGYLVAVEGRKAVLARTTFDETDLDPATNWKQPWQNQEPSSTHKGFVDFSDAMAFLATALAEAEQRRIEPAEIVRIQRFDPAWIDGRCEISSLAELLAQN